jgi:hypothetical protein
MFKDFLALKEDPVWNISNKFAGTVSSSCQGANLNQYNNSVICIDAGGFF